MTRPVADSDLRAAAGYLRNVRSQAHQAEINLEVAKGLLEDEQALLTTAEAGDDKDEDEIKERRDAVRAYKEGVRQHERALRNAEISERAIAKQYPSDSQKKRIELLIEELELLDKKERLAHEAQLDAKVAEPKPRA